MQSACPYSLHIGQPGSMGNGYPQRGEKLGRKSYLFLSLDTNANIEIQMSDSSAGMTGAIDGSDVIQ
ncbi:hypothetical protein FACS1894130_00610 [Spirochaetia bacterium]|nr:hypothetical protein FACS1894130_00610 [Spirochaetia bacterium]